MVISEVKPKNNRYPLVQTEFNISDYDLFAENIETVNGRGLLIYTRKWLKASIVNLSSKFSEFIAVKLNCNNGEQLIIVGIYKSPNTSDDNEKELFNLLYEVTRGSSRVIITGDFNYRGINWDSMEIFENNMINKNFIEVVEDCFLIQHVNLPTRARIGQNPSILDLILTNNENSIEDLVVESPLGKSDHGCLKFKIKCNHTKENTRRKVFLYRRGNYQQMKTRLQEVNWNVLLGVTESIDEMYHVFTETLLQIQEQYIPSKQIKEGKRKKAYSLLPHEVSAIKKKHRAWQRYYETKEISKYKEYVKNRNKVKKITRQAKKRLEDQICEEVKTNPKAFWSYVNSGSKCHDTIPELDMGNNIATTDNEKANMLAEYFCSVYTREPEDDVPEGNIHTDSEPLCAIQITEREVMKILEHLKPNKSAGPDNLHPKILKECAKEIAVPLTVIYLRSLETGILPSIWKTARVTAIYKKKGDKKKTINYRPISLTCVTCKVMETLIRDSIIHHMTQNNLLTNQQYGFVSKRSTILQLLHVLEEWTSALDCNKDIDVAYMDFQKAFDKVPHRRLLHKISRYNIQGALLQWLTTYLTNRTQEVVVNGHVSRKTDVYSGIPQGSVLGPTLFIIFINDLPSEIQSSIYLFADDTKLFNTIGNINDQPTLQRDLSKIYDWTTTWMLPLNEDKCSVMHIGNRFPSKEFHLNNNSQPMKTTQAEKDLGVIFTNQASFRTHIQQQAQKANRLVGVIRRNFQNLTPSNFTLLFKTLIRPIIEYAAPVWHPYLKTDIKTIEDVQRRATKCITGMRQLTYQQRLQALQLPTLAFRRWRGDLIETYKIFNHYKTNYQNFFTLNNNINTRGHSLKLQKNFSRTNIRKYSFSNRIIDSWNSLPESIASAPSINTFKNRLDRHTKSHPALYDWEANLSA